MTPRTVALQAPLPMRDSPGKNTGVGCHALLQGIFPIQGSNPGLPHCRWILYHLSNQEGPSLLHFWLPSWLSGKESACNTTEVYSIPGSGRSPGKGHGNPLQYSCLENSMDRGAWQAAVQGVAKRWTQLKRLST